MDIDPADTARIRHIMSDLEESDFELHDPPAAIWERIEASVNSQIAKQPPSRDTPPRLIIEYRIDARDVLTDVGEGWAEFARDNGASELAVPAPARTLWSYIDRAEIRELWQLLVQRARALQREVRVPFRCDAPAARRWFEMTITPKPDSSVHFRSVLAFEEARLSVALLELDTERDADAQVIPLCSWCSQALHGTRWTDVEELVQAGRLLERSSMPPISYGICGGCREEMAAELLIPARAGEPPA